MEKLRLAVEQLVVETFEASGLPLRMGTVHARDSAITDEYDSCGVETECGANGCSAHCGSAGCPGSDTCPGYYSCAGVYTCGGVDTCQWPACTQDPQNVC
jgi:hypothetical protein